MSKHASRRYTFREKMRMAFGRVRKPRIVLKERGFVVDYGIRDPWEYAEDLWDDVERLVAYKRDCITWDTICIDIFLKGAESVPVVDENMEGWEDFLRALSTRLPGSMWRDTIYGKVMKPAFATNTTVVYERGGRNLAWG